MINQPPDDYCLTAETQWTNLNEPASGATGGIWHSSSSGVAAVMKPANIAQGRVEPFREWLASRLAWSLDVNVPRVELYSTVGGPAALSFRPGPVVHAYAAALSSPLRTAALSAFARYSNVLVLDVLIGAEDRSTNNLVYDEASSTWYSIDYSYCLSIGAGRGRGSASQAYVQPYFPEFIQAVRGNTALIASTLLLAEQIAENDIEALCSKPPPEFCDGGERLQTVEYLASRLTQIRQLLNQWLASHSIPPV